MDEAVIARAIWENMRCLVNDYSDVDFDMIMRRPRYSGLRGVIFIAARRVIEASALTPAER